MKVTAPQMGLLQILLEDLFDRLGVEFVPAPPSSEKALEIGSRLGPELGCLPLKVTLGNFIQGLEKGADTILMAGGTGPCRFGYYGQIQRLIMQKAGYKFKTIIIEPPVGNLSKFISAFKQLCPEKNIYQLYKIIQTSFYKTQAVDFVEKKSLQLRAYERVRGAVSAAKKRGIEIIRRAKTRNEIEEAKREALNELDKPDLDLSRRVLRVGLTGEFYLLLEPFVNFDIEEYLGHNNIYVERSVYVSDWISPSQKNRVFGIREKDVIKTAQPFLSHSVGGEGQSTISHTIHFAKSNFDGVIHLFPFTCMPEIIAETILPSVIKKHDIPLLTLILDEQVGRAGLVTRLEAFIDLLNSRQNHKNRGGALCEAT